MQQGHVFFKLCPVVAESTAHDEIFFRLLELELNTGTESVFFARNEPEPKSLFYSAEP